MNIFEYDLRTTFEQRKKDVDDILTKYPDRIPILIQKTLDNKLPSLKKNKYLVSPDMMLLNFMFIIRKNILLRQEQALMFFIGENNLVVAPNKLMKEIYKDYKSKDGFLRIIYGLENTFG